MNKKSLGYFENCRETLEHHAAGPRLHLRPNVSMSSPSKPLSIGSPRPTQQIDDGNEESVAHTPDLRQLRQQFGTPPVGTTIPPFRSAASLGVGSPLRPSSSADIRPQSFRPAPSSALPSGSGAITPLETPDAPALGEEEKIKILRKHLVSREERMGHNRNPSNQSRHSSRRPSIHENQTPAKGSSQHASRPETPAGPSQASAEPFPIPYHAPGGDITYVCSITRRILFA